MAVRPMISRSAITELETIFDESPDFEPDEFRKFEAVRILAPRIYQMTKKGYTWPRIVEMMASKGIDVTVDTLKAYLAQARTPKRRKASPASARHAGPPGGTPEPPVAESLGRPHTRRAAPQASDDAWGAPERAPPASDGHDAAAASRPARSLESPTSAPSFASGSSVSSASSVGVAAVRSGAAMPESLRTAASDPSSYPVTAIASATPQRVGTTHPEDGRPKDLSRPVPALRPEPKSA